MADVLVDSYAETEVDAGTNLSDGTATVKGQSFTGLTGKILYCKFYLKKSGNPTGNAVAKLYAHTGTYGTSGLPDGAALATSDNLDVSTLGAAYALTTLTFTGAQQYSMSGGTYYVIVLEYSAGDGSNYVIMGCDTGSPTHVGNGVYYDTQWRVSVNDRAFYVYKEDLGATTTTSSTSSTTTSSTTSTTSSSTSSTTTLYSDSLDVMLKPRVEILPIVPIIEVKRTYRHPS